MIVLIGNYAPDNQQSMLRFAEMMREGLLGAEEAVCLLAPAACFGRLLPYRGHGLSKWLGYLDKFVIFPWVLRRRLARLARLYPGKLVVHLCDHSNSPYAKAAKSTGAPLITTCHDLGAVRGALGEDTDCPASRTGKLFQRWICNSLGLADCIACDSTATRQDVERLVRTPESIPPRSETVLLGLNARYRRLQSIHTEPVLREACPKVLGEPYLLHVGSSLDRKNRDGILRIFSKIAHHWSGNLVFAGQALTSDLLHLAAALGLTDRVIQIHSPSNQLLEALYNRAFALLFPSKFEGFGWPVIEAQACGCPVLCSDAASLREVALDSAFVRPWQAEPEFAGEILRMTESKARRDHWIEQGLLNLPRFSKDRMISDYRRLYSELLEPSPDSTVHSGTAATS